VGARVRRVSLILSIILGAVLSGCATDVTMVNPRTGDMTACRASLHGLNPWSQQQACIGEHIADGWARRD